MATPRKSDEEYPGYLADQDRKPFIPTAREEELLSKTVHPEEFAEFKIKINGAVSNIMLEVDLLKSRVERLEVRFNEVCRMLSVQLANSGFELLRIKEE